MKPSRFYEIILIYATGLMQGLILVTLPAVSAVFTAVPFDFSKSQYGSFFIPQVICSIAAALLAPAFSRRLGSKPVYQIGLILNILAMGLMTASQQLAGHHTAVYVCILAATAAVGAGFGTTLPMINVYVQRFFPDATAPAITGLHTLLGTGTALAPLLAVVFMRWLAWWTMPAAAFFILLALLAVSFFLPLQGQTQEGTTGPVPGRLPIIFWLFIAAIFFYGYCETIFSNWAIIYLSNEHAFSAASASYALAVFWAAVTGGRLLVTLVSRWVPLSGVYRFLPWLMAGALALIATVHSAVAGIVSFGCAGLACSAFFPLSFSFAQKRFESMAEKVSGGLMAAYMLGYGLASYGIGKIMDISGISLGNLYRDSVPVALAVGVLAGVLMRPKPASP